MKLKIQFMFALILMGVLVGYFTIIIIISYCQTGVWFPDAVPDSSFHSAVANTRRFVRCSNQSVAPWQWRTDVSVFCAKKRTPILAVGVVQTGDEIADFVSRILLHVPQGECVPSVHFFHFSAEQVDVFEAARSYPSYVDGWLLFGGHFNVRSSRWPHLPRYGIIGLSAENCFNAASMREVEPAFGFLTYGDCAITDNHRFFTFPLGPYLPAHPTISLNDFHLSPPSERDTLLNGRFTMTPRKPSRRAWLMEAQKYCITRGARCALNTDWDYYLPSFFTTDHYVDLLKDAVFTLCPSGNNFEQYRIWEAIFAGSIPIVEDVADELRSPGYVSPAYGRDYYCVPTDVHYILKESHAPVLFIKKAAELHNMLASHNLSRLNEIQHELVAWRENLFLHYRILLFRLLHEHFSDKFYFKNKLS